MKTILITGSTDGIGKQTAMDLAEMGHNVIIHGRNEEKCLDALNEIREKSGSNNLHYVVGDLSDFLSIKKLAEQISLKFDKLDVLLNNAGVFENEHIILPNGLEKTFMVNHMGYFALTLQLLDLLKASGNSRIVNVSSQAQAGTMDFDNLNGEKYFDGFNAYALSKLENVLFTYKLARELKGEKVTVNALHPGVVATKLLHAGWGGGGAPVESGTHTSVYVATSESLKGVSGLYFVYSQARRSSAISYDQKIQNRLWEISLDYSGL